MKIKSKFTAKEWKIVKRYVALQKAAYRARKKEEKEAANNG